MGNSSTPGWGLRPSSAIATTAASVRHTATAVRHSTATAEHLLPQLLVGGAERREHATWHRLRAPAGPILRKVRARAHPFSAERAYSVHVSPLYSACPWCCCRRTSHAMARFREECGLSVKSVLFFQSVLCLRSVPARPVSPMRPCPANCAPLTAHACAYTLKVYKGNRVGNLISQLICTSFERV